MPLNSTTLSRATTTTQAVAGVILVNAQEDVGYQTQKPGSGLLNRALKFIGVPPPSFYFHNEGENTATIESDITDHYTEANSAIQDQIALKPEKITVHGFIGELNDVPPRFLAPFKSVKDKLTILSAYKPGLSISAIRAYNRAQQLYATASLAKDAAVGALNSISSLAGSGGGGIQTKQQKAFYQFYGYWQKRTLFTIQTPWAVFENMAILSLRAIQEENTRMITDFEITFKKIRFAEVTTLATLIGAGRFANAAEGVAELGASSPAEAGGFGDFFASSYPGVL